MLLVLARRLGNVVPTLLAVVALIFLLFSVLPGSFISGMSEDGRSTIDPAVMERMRKEMGLDDPLYERFAKYVAKLATGDLGTSFRTREPVTKLIGARIWPSLKLVFAAMTFAIVDRRDRWASSRRCGRAACIDTVSMVGADLGPVAVAVLVRPDADVPVRAEARTGCRASATATAACATSSCPRSRSASARWRCWRAPRAPPCSTS